MLRTDGDPGRGKREDDDVDMVQKFEEYFENIVNEYIVDDDCGYGFQYYFEAIFILHTIKCRIFDVIIHIYIYTYIHIYIYVYTLMWLFLVLNIQLLELK